MVKSSVYHFLLCLRSFFIVTRSNQKLRKLRLKWKCFTCTLTLSLSPLSKTTLINLSPSPIWNETKSHVVTNVLNTFRLVQLGIVSLSVIYCDVAQVNKIIVVNELVTSVQKINMQILPLTFMRTIWQTIQLNIFNKPHVNTTNGRRNQ